MSNPFEPRTFQDAFDQNNPPIPSISVTPFLDLLRQNINIPRSLVEYALIKGIKNVNDLSDQELLELIAERLTEMLANDLNAESFSKEFVALDSLHVDLVKKLGIHEG